MGYRRYRGYRGYRRYRRYMGYRRYRRYMGYRRYTDNVIWISDGVLTVRYLCLFVSWSYDINV